MFFNKPLQINSMLTSSRSNGPGLRYVIWVQGCSIHCPDCSNKDTWDPQEGFSISVNSLVGAIKQVINNPKDEPITGVTITGGEPLDQYKAVYELCKKLFPITSIFLTTGYTPKDLVLNRNLKIFDYLDMVCIGPFILEKICSNEWKGSSNQEISYLTDRGREMTKLPVIQNEIFINPDGSIIETGFTV